MTERQRKTGSRILTAIIISVFFLYLAWVTCELQRDPTTDKIGRGLRSPGGWNFYQKLKKEGYPDGYTVKCMGHHDIIPGRSPKAPRFKCAPGVDPLREDTVVPF